MSDDRNSDFVWALEGELKEGDIFSILFHIYKKDISGELSVQAVDCEKTMTIQERKIVFASSTKQADALSDYLLNNHYIDIAIYDAATEHLLANKVRFGRALLELGYFTYEQMWTWIPAHLKAIIKSFFHIKSGRYRFKPQSAKQKEVNSYRENIVLDETILDFLLEGIRRTDAIGLFKNRFAAITNLYVWYPNVDLLEELDLKPYERHVFHLVERVGELKEILKRSELLEIDTLRYLYLYLLLEILSIKKCPKTLRMEKPDSSEEHEEANGRFSTTFNSFEEALKYYNMKYEIIYKLMLKQIGPISISLLLKAIEDIMDNLPGYFQKIQLKSDGTIDEEPILKAVWYHDFDRHIGEFLRGLEEVLYTEIYAVKKHLGVDYEQQVLKWIKGIGN
jgi:hypothetical protein